MSSLSFSMKSVKRVKRKKNIRGKKIDVCAPRGTLGVRRTLSKDSKLGKRAVLPPHG